METATITDIFSILQKYYETSRERCKPANSRNIAINKLRNDIDEIVALWETHVLAAEDF